MAETVMRFGLNRRVLLQGGVASGLVAGLPAGVLAAQAGSAAAGGDVVVMTKQGRLRGRRVGDVTEFRGVRYAEPQTAANRYRAPVPLKPWTGTRDALADGNQALQFGVDAQLWSSAFRDFNPMSEDCLFLNVHTPSTAPGRKRAVMFWCHGGGFATGSATVPAYDGHNVAAYGDVVVVAPNHRLSSLGFVNLKDVAGDDFADAGTAGLLDLIEALRWVRDNIAEFGGDPNNVTIFGQSGGGAKVSTLLAIPEAQGLFHKAIVQSGSALRQRTREESEKPARMLLANLGLQPSEAGRIREFKAYEVLVAATRLRGQFAPVVDGVHLPRHPFDPDAPPQAKGIPMIIGSAQTESSSWATDDQFELSDADMKALLVKSQGDKILPLIDAYKAAYPGASPSDLYFRIGTDTGFRSSAIAQAERKVRQGGSPVFMYLISWKSPVDGSKWRSPHSIDLPFMWHNQRLPVLKNVVGAGPEQDALADQMTSAWVSFAKTGDPSNKVTGRWTPYDLQTRTTMVFDRAPTLVADPDSTVRQLFMAQA